MSKHSTLKPGMKVKYSGQYELRGVRGGKSGQEYTFVKGHIAPPTPEARQKFVLVDKTKHKS